MGACLILDEKMEFLARLSSDDPDAPEHKAKVQVYHAFVSGLIKGVLTHLGAEGPIDVKLKMVQEEKSLYPKLQIELNYMERNRKTTERQA